MTVIKIRRDTAANWTAANPVLGDGEIGVEKGTPPKLKVGNGATAWNALPYLAAGVTPGSVTTEALSDDAVTPDKLSFQAAKADDPRFVAAGGDKQSSSFTLGANHAGSVTEVDSAAAVTVTVPSAALVPWADHTQIKIRQVGAGQVTIAPGAGVTLRAADGGLKTASQYKAVLLDRRPAGQSTTTPPAGSLLARWRADDLTGAHGSSVSSWPDLTGNVPPAVQATAANQPTLRTGTNGINGRKTINFDSTTDFLTLSGSALSLAQNRTALTVVVVYRYLSAQAGARTFLSLSSNASATARRMHVGQRSSTGAFIAGTHIKDTDTTAFIAPSNSAGSTVGAAGVLAVQFDYANGTILFHKDGAQQGTAQAFQAASKGVTDNTPSLAGFIGNTLGSQDFYGGELAEILVYGSISSSLLPAVDTYVQGFYAIPMADSTAVGDEWVVEGGVA